MRDHAVEARAARDALHRRDLDGIRSAGLAIARPDPAPGLPEVGRAPLEQVRRRGRALAEVTELADAARGLVALTEPCAACHVALGVVETRSPGEPPRDLLWSALLFESEACWVQGAASLPEGSVLAAGRDWASRRGVVARQLTEDDLRSRPDPASDG